MPILGPHAATADREQLPEIIAAQGAVLQGMVYGLQEYRNKKVCKGKKNDDYLKKNVSF